MFTVNYQTSPVKVKKLSERGFRGFSARKRLRKWTARRPETLSKELQMALKEDGFGDAREHLDILALDRDVLNKESYNYG